MDMLNLTKSSLEAQGAFTPSINQHVASVMSAIPFNVPERVKAVIAQSQVTSFASQFRRNIKLWDDSSIPVNSISFCIMGSGDGKDSSVKSARKCFTPGYEMVEDARKAQAHKLAQSAAREAGESLYTDLDIYKSYLKPLPPLDIRTTTGPGFIQHINDLGEHTLGAGITYSGEFADELAYNQDMLENIKIISEIYDTGDADVKYTKAIEHRSKSISGQPVSALYVTSPSHILYDEPTKKKFQVAFMSKLARRSWFCYTPEAMPKPSFSSVDEMIDYELAIETKAKTARSSMQSQICRIAEFGIRTATNDITVPESVFKLYKTYLRYNSELAETLPNQHSTAVLVRRHLQWKALKLAGALAIFDLSNEITPSHYIDAIRFCELLAGDIALFEADLNKADHERMADYIKSLVQLDGKAFISIHDLKKRGFTIATTANKLKELCTLANAYDPSGIYSTPHDSSGIHYEAIIKSDVVGISFKPINLAKLNAATTPDQVRQAKADIAATTAYGYESAETTFADLANLLQGAYAYSPFKFTNGIRGKDHISGGTSWCVLDIDDSSITAEETHFMLSDIQHIIALSSDPQNEYKFRILLKFDGETALSATEWRIFFKHLCEELGVQADLLPQSQIYFSYPDRKIYSSLEVDPLPIKWLLTKAKAAAAEKSLEEVQLSPGQKKALLSDKLTTFHFAFDAKNGAASRQVIRAILYAKTLGASLQESLELFQEIQDYWEVPFSADRQEAFIAQITRLYR